MFRLLGWAVLIVVIIALLLVFGLLDAIFYRALLRQVRPSLRGAQRRSNPVGLWDLSGLLRSARNDGGNST